MLNGCRRSPFFKDHGGRPMIGVGAAPQSRPVMLCAAAAVSEVRSSSPRRTDRWDAPGLPTLPGRVSLIWAATTVRASWMLLGMQESHLDISDPTHRAIAARALATGDVIGHAVANIYVLGAHPAAHIVRAVNLMKGRPPNQVGSVTTTRELVPNLFDWSRLPPGLTRDRMLRI